MKTAMIILIILGLINAITSFIGMSSYITEGLAWLVIVGLSIEIYVLRSKHNDWPW